MNLRSLYKYYIALFTFILLILFSDSFQRELKVHLIPHSHQDVGWLCTYDEYFYGFGNCTISVKSIINNIVDSLVSSPNRTFVYSETAFFKKWWLEANETYKINFKNLLKEKRLEIVNGGFVMNDEAAAYHTHILDQMRHGLSFINNTLNVFPETAWSIDPFGHSSTNTQILINLGFKNLVIQRIDYKQKDEFRKNKKMEFFWFPFETKYSNNSIFTHVLYDDYCPIDFINPDFIHDIPISLSDKNWFMLAKRFYDYIMRTYAVSYATDNILLPYGCDFAFKNKFNFFHIEKIMNIIKQNKKIFPDINIFYSTPHQYFTAVRNSSNFEFEIIKKTIINDDFLPYASGEANYWTGYYSTRPYLKGLIRDAGNLLKKSSDYFSSLFTSHVVDKMNLAKKIIELREVIAVNQHHDAVTGTSKKHVIKDYIQMLSEKIFSLKSLLSSSIADSIMLPPNKVKLISDSFVSDKNSTNYYMNFKSDTEEKMLILYNRGYNGKRIFKFISNQPYITITSFLQGNIPYEYIRIDDEYKKFYIDNLQNLDNNFTDNNKTHFIFKNNGQSISSEPLYEIYFEVKFTYKEALTILVVKAAKQSTEKQFKKNNEIVKSFLNNSQKINLTENEFMVYNNNTYFTYFKFDQSHIPENIIKTNFEISNKYLSHHDSVYNNTLNYYKATNPDEYIMSVSSVESFDYNNFLLNKTIYEGSLFTKIIFEFENSAISLIILRNSPTNKIIKNSKINNYTYLNQENSNNYIIEIENILYPRNKFIENCTFNTSNSNDSYNSNNTCVGKEILLNIDTDIQNIKSFQDFTYPAYDINEPYFITDSNGINYNERISNYRKNFWLFTTDAISSNYYPINKFINIEDIQKLKNTSNFTKRYLYAFNERSQAGSSLYKGNINLIIERFSRIAQLETGEIFMDDEIFSQYFISKLRLLFGTEDLNYLDFRNIEKITDDSILIYLVEEEQENTLIKKLSYLNNFNYEKSI